jgi:hypothetical protein
MVAEVSACPLRQVQTANAASETWTLSAPSAHAAFRASAWSVGLAGGHGGGRICLREGATTHLG